MKTMLKLFVLLLLATAFGCQTVRKMTDKDYATGSVPEMGQVIVVLGVWENETDSGPMEFTVVWRPLILDHSATTIQTFQYYGGRPYLTYNKDKLVGSKAVVTEGECGGVCLMPL